MEKLLKQITALDWDYITRHPLFLIGVVAVILIVFYYFASPYENCVRDGLLSGIGCGKYHSW